jgi:DNA-binding transcriptional regulator YiaG
MTPGRFKKLRQSMGYSQVRLAEKMGVYVRTVSRWETGEVEIPKMAELALRYIADQENRRDR